MLRNLFPRRKLLFFNDLKGREIKIFCFINVILKFRVFFKFKIRIFVSVYRNFVKRKKEINYK